MSKKSSEKDKLIEIYKRNSFTIPYKDTLVSFSINNLLSTDIYEIPFAIITAENPMNKSCPDEINNQYNKKLEEEIDELKYDYKKCVGEEGNHSENSFIIYNIKKDVAIDLGTKFKQYSIFYNSGSELSYIECDTRTTILREKIII